MVYGTGSGDTLDALVSEKNKKYDFKLSKLPAGAGPSDHDSFYRKKIPVLFFYTGTHDQYHRPTDKPELINVPAMRKVVDLVQDLADTLTTVPTPPKYQVTRDPWTDPTSPHATSNTMKLTGPKLGVMPDYEYAGDGMRLAVKIADGDEKAGVAAGSGKGSPSRVRVYFGKNFTGAGERSAFQDLDPFGTTLPGGALVG